MVWRLSTMPTKYIHTLPLDGLKLNYCSA